MVIFATVAKMTIATQQLIKMMNTKYILHGGFTPGSAQEDDAFFAEVLSTAPDNAKVLLVYFAKELDRIPKNSAEDMDQFNKNKGAKSLSFQIAEEQNFLSQIAWADVVYLHGGSSSKSIETLKKFPDLKSAFQGKIIAGDSAGANPLAAAFHSILNGLLEGLGILPIRLMCHYAGEVDSGLANIHPDFELVTLREYEFRVFDM